MTMPNPYGATVLRLILGVIFVMHAYLALVVLTPAGAAAGIRRMGLPFPDLLVWYLILGHGIGGLMMILGLWTRWAALANAPIMAGAVLGVHLAQGFFMRGIVIDRAAGTAIAAGYEYALLVLAATLAQALLGGGALALTRDR